MERVPSEGRTAWSSRIASLVIICALGAAFVSGGGVYSYQKIRSDKVQKDLRAQISILKSELATPSIATPTATSQPSPSSASVIIPNGYATYTSVLGNYTFRYPSVWVSGHDSASETKTSGYSSTVILYKDQGEKSADSGAYQVAVSTQPTTETLEQEVRDRAASVTKQNPDFKPVIANVSLGAHKIAKLDIDNYGATETIYYFVENNSVFIISSHMHADANTKSEVIQQIIGTIIFK